MGIANGIFGKRVGVAWSLNKPILSMRDGAFVRAGEASYLPSDGLRRWAVSGEQRFVDGVYSGEGSVKNEIIRSEEIENAAWILNNSSGNATVTADQGAAPDGDVDADEIHLGASTSDFCRQAIGNGVFPDSTNITLSAWLKGDVGGEDAAIAIRDKAGNFATGLKTLSLTTSWARYDLTKSTGVGANPVYFEFRNGSATAKTFQVGGTKLELGDFPTSDIRTTTAAVTRPADDLTFVAAQVPGQLLTGRVRFRFRPSAASTDTRVAQRILSMNADQDRLNLVTSDTLAVTAGGVSKVVTAALVWGRNSTIDVILDAAAGLITTQIDGGAPVTVVGTAWTWVSSALRIGAKQTDGTLPFFADISDIFAV